MKSSLLLLFNLLLFAATAHSQELAQTRRLEWPEADLSDRLMTGAHRFVERKIAESPAKRAALWARDYVSPQAYEKSVEPNRARLGTIVGVVDKRLPAAMERYGDEANPALVAETEHVRIYQVRWPVLDGFWGCGLLAEPKGSAVARVVVVPDAAQTPEQLLGLAPGASQAARRLAENGFEVVVPVTISRDRVATNDQQLRATDQTCREWIYRQAFHMGRHVIGYEVQMVLAAVDWMHARGGKVGVCGYAEGGQTAFYAAALDTRISAALVSGYYDSRQRVWAEPIYRNVWGLLREFGDAEIAGLILPRTLVIEYSSVPDINGQKGEWHTPEYAGVSAEVARIETGSLCCKPDLLRSAGAPFSDQALARFAAALGVEARAELSGDAPVDRRSSLDTAARHLRLLREMEGHVQGLVRRSEQAREREFLFSAMPELEMQQWTTEPQLPTHSPEKFVAGATKFRERFRDEAMGRFDEPLLPRRARTRVVKATRKWTAHDVVLDVYPELFAWGIVVVPSDLKPGERRPVVVCQHGRHGLPRNLLDAHTTGYRDVAAALAERGFVTFAPHNLYRGEDRYRWLNRKANNVKATLFSFIIASHDQILRWLQTQPFVDGSRIGFYGLSYGGETAMRVPPLLESYTLSICSGDFNQWTHKVAATDQPFSFMRTIEWEMPYWNLGNSFDYAEMAYLIFPRPFMVERGHLDLVGRDQWVAHEYAKVRWLYAQLGLADRTQIEFFQGGHSMRAAGTFAFLHKHLRWPEPAKDQDRGPHGLAK
jgi:dienelactone hydrolase